MAIKISDISVGDWVEWKVYDKSYDILVTQITDTLIRGVHDGIEYGMLLKQISPIPITPEILEANGFVKNGEYDEWNIGIWETPYLLGVSLGRPAVTIKWNGSSIFIDQAKNVHQLQHALRLAGVEKEIVINK